MEADPSWPPAPDGWQFWVQTERAMPAAAPADPWAYPDGTPSAGRGQSRRKWWRRSLRAAVVVMGGVAAVPITLIAKDKGHAAVAAPSEPTVQQQASACVRVPKVVGDGIAIMTEFLDDRDLSTIDAEKLDDLVARMTAMQPSLPEPMRKDLVRFAGPLVICRTRSTMDRTPALSSYPPPTPATLDPAHA